MTVFPDHPLAVGSTGRQRLGPAREGPGDVPRVRVLTPLDPATGPTVRETDVLESVHRVTTQVPDPRKPMAPRS